VFIYRRDAPEPDKRLARIFPAMGP
jgi:hypothetical protein